MSTIAEAATVIVVRDAASAAPQILMVERAKTMAFMANAIVFPGGRVDAADGAGEDRFARAASRELAEEAGVALEAASLALVAHWLTPSVEPRRYDTKFFLGFLPVGQTAHHDENETVAHLWASAKELVARYEAGTLKLAPPTWFALSELAAFDNCADIKAWAKRRHVARITPKLIAREHETLIYLPWHRDYVAQAGEGEPFAPNHPSATGAALITLRDGRWWAK